VTIAERDETADGTRTREASRMIVRWGTTSRLERPQESRLGGQTNSRVLVVTRAKEPRCSAKS
jgi:hypothetical protein